MTLYNFSVLGTLVASTTVPTLISKRLNSSIVTRPVELSMAHESGDPLDFRILESFDQLWDLGPTITVDSLEGFRYFLAIPSKSSSTMFEYRSLRFVK